MIGVSSDGGRMTKHFAMGYWTGFIVSTLTYIILNAIFAHPAHAQSVEDMITVEAAAQGMDPAIALAVARVESGLNQQKRGLIGEIGIFQIRPEFTHADITKLPINVKEGVRQLMYWKQHCPVKEQAEYVICYNGGNRHPRYPQLHPYYKKVRAAL